MMKRLGKTKAKKICNKMNTKPFKTQFSSDLSLKRIE